MDEVILYMIAVMYFESESKRLEKYGKYKQWCITAAQLYREKIKKHYEDNPI